VVLKNFILIIIITILFVFPVNAKQISVDNIEKIFKNNLPECNEIIYTKVPRGLIISIDEKVFFDECELNIKENSFYILDILAGIIKNLPNRFIIEDHVRNECTENLAPWEISMIRASNISEYFLKYKGISNEQIFDIGFGGFMPFKDNVTGGAAPLNNRVDFIIIEYEVKR